MAEDPAIRCVVIRGAGDHFMAGGDISYFYTLVEKAPADRQAVNWIAQDFSVQHLDGCRLVYAAIDDKGLAARISEAAQSRNIPVNVVDQPEFCSFITPAIVDRDPVVVAIGTEGTAPVLARGRFPPVAGEGDPGYRAPGGHRKPAATG